MPEVIGAQFVFATSALEAKDFTTDPALTGGPSPITRAPSYAEAEVRGFCLGPPGAYAMLGFEINDFQAPPQFGYPSGVMVVPTGQRFKVRLNRNQSVYALASVSPNVPWGTPADIVSLSYQITYGELILQTGGADGGGGGDGGGGADSWFNKKITGPKVGWRKG